MMPLTDLYPELLLHAPACPQPLAERALIRSAIRFCRDTQVIRETVGPVRLPPGTTTIELADYAEEGVPFALVDLNVNGVPMRKALKKPPVQWGGSTILFRPNERVVEFAPALEESIDITLTMATAPASTAKQIDDELATRWRDGVIGGAIAYLCAMPGQAFTSADLAMYGAQMYANDRGRARMAVNAAYDADPRVEMRPLA